MGATLEEPKDVEWDSKIKHGYIFEEHHFGVDQIEIPFTREPTVEDETKSILVQTNLELNSLTYTYNDIELNFDETSSSDQLRLSKVEPENGLSEIKITITPKTDKSKPLIISYQGLQIASIKLKV